MDPKKVKTLSKQYLESVVGFRRQFHQNPELAFEEQETANFIQERLQDWNIEFQAKVAKTGIVAQVKGKNPDSKTVALRADMDALPIHEENDAPYRSLNPGKMHACGHDAHMASLMGAAKILNDLKSEFEGTVKLLFQPSEERFPGGASVMIKEGALENPKPSSIFGQHVHPPLQAGKVGFRSGKYMASADELYIEIIGKGGHAALPQDCIDPIFWASTLIVQLQSIVARNADPFDSSVLSFGKIEGLGATNIIPDKVRIEGTFRAMNENWRDKAHQLIADCCKGVEKSSGAKVSLQLVKGYPFLVNEPALTSRSRRWAEDFLGKENVVDLEQRMGAEDFAYYSQVMPGCFYRLGTRNEAEGIVHGLHTPKFDIDESSLETGMGLMAWLALKELEHSDN